MEKVSDNKHRIVRYRGGFRFKVPAEKAHEECSRVIKACDPGDDYCQALVEASRPEKAVLHDEFEWDDEVAANQHRRSQAACIYRSIEVLVEERPATRAFQTIDIEIIQKTDDGEEKERPRIYMSHDDAMRDPKARRILLDRALRELRSARQRYSSLMELNGIFQAIDAQLEEQEKTA